MGAVRVHSLALRLVAPAALREQAQSLRSRAETMFVPALLQALAQRLDRVYGPDAVLRIPALRLRLRLPASGLATAAHADLVGEDLAQQVEAWLERRPAGEPADGSSAPAHWYRDTAQWQAVRLVAAARGIAGPAAMPETFGEVWSAVAAAPSHERAAVLLELARTQGREAVLARWPAAQLRRVLRWLPAQAPEAWKAELRQRLRPTQRTLEWHEDAVSQQDGIAATTEVPPRERNESEAAAPEPMPAPLASLPAPGEDPPEPQSSRERAPAAALAAPTALAGDTEPAAPAALGETAGVQVPAPRSPALHTVPSPAIQAQRRPPTQPATQLATPDSVVAGEPGPTREGDIQQPARWASHWCGLPCLLNISLRLELPERLWQAGLPEGDVLAAMFARIAGTDEDPAVRMLSPAFPAAAANLPSVPAWAREELMTGLAQAVLRWPALQPQHELLHARVAELQAWLGVGAAFDLPAWAAAWHLAIAEALLQERLSPADLARRFAAEGVIACDGEALRVLQPMQAVDIAMRRAGLDADPGWLPWLRKRMVFVFEGAEPLEQ